MLIESIRNCLIVIFMVDFLMNQYNDVIFCNMSSEKNLTYVKLYNVAQTLYTWLHIHYAIQLSHPDYITQGQISFLSCSETDQLLYAGIPLFNSSMNINILMACARPLPLMYNFH